MYKNVIALVLVGSVYSAADGAVPTVCAVIKAQTSGEISTGVQELLEQRLLMVPSITIVERSLIDKILAELALSTSQGKLELKKRLQLGKLLKADILVFLSEAKWDKNTSVSVRVVESETGLQLAAETCLWEKDDAEATLTSLFGAVSTGLERHRTGFRAIVAVPPLECTDRSPNQAHWRRPLATLLQERLLAHKGILVVELDEARAFSTEFFIGNEPARVKHDLPLFLLGKYSTRSDGENLVFSFELILSQGDKKVLHTTEKDIQQTSVFEHFSRVVQEIAVRLQDSNHDAVSVDPGKEAVLLTKRADLFRKLGEYDVALPLYEAVLLIDPDSLKAHVFALAILESLTDRISYEYTMQTWIGKEAGNLDLWVAEHGIDHFEYLCRNAPLSVSVKNTLSNFRRGLSVLCYWAPEGSVDHKTRVIRFLRRREVAWLAFIQRLKDKKAFDPVAQSYLIAEFGWLVGDAVRSDPEAALASMRQLIDTVQAEDQAQWYLINAVSFLGTDMDEVAPTLYEHFLDELVASDRLDLQLAGKIGRLCMPVGNPESQQKALTEIHKLDEWKTFSEKAKKYIERGVELCMKYRIHRNGGFANETKSVFVPHFEVVSATLENSGPMALRQVRDWVNCGNLGDCIATDAGIFLLDGHTGRRISQVAASQICWDGEWIWAATETQILAVEPQLGTTQTFAPSDLGYEIRPGYLLCPVKRGVIAVVGYLFALHRATRCWVSLLAISDGAEGASKQARLIYDAREQADPTKIFGESWSLKEAFVPIWALTYRQKPPDGAPLLLIGRGGSRRVQPLVINLEDEHVTLVRPPWPGFGDVETSAYVVRYDDTFYIAVGQSREPKAWAGVFQTHSLDIIPQMFGNFGVRRENQFYLFDRSYFYGGVVHDNVLHLLTQFSDMSPHWVAVDLRTRQTSVLATTLPPAFWGERGLRGSSTALPTFTWPTDYCDWKEHRLVESSKQGLVFLAQGRAYAVTLPDRNAWPRFPKTPTNETTLFNWPPSKDK